LAESIEKEFDFEVQLQSGKLHGFEVLFDEELIFSMFEEGRFPEPEEVIALIRTSLDQK
jgi:predicted Rdx family selenoprotein